MGIFWRLGAPSKPVVTTVEADDDNTLHVQWEDPPYTDEDIQVHTNRAIRRILKTAF